MTYKEEKDIVQPIYNNWRKTRPVIVLNNNCNKNHFSRT